MRTPSSALASVCVLTSCFLASCVLVSGCYAAHPAEGGPGVVPPGFPDAGSDARPPPRRDAGPDAVITTDPRPPLPVLTREVDLLLVVDNSTDMVEEQISLTFELPRLINILLTGDYDQDGDIELESEDFLPLESLNIGVVTTDMGTGGFTVPTCRRSAFGDDGILRDQGTTEFPGCRPTYPLFLSYTGGSIADFAEDTNCVATVGTFGCGFEQQLEAGLKSISPSAATSYTADGYLPPVFFRDTFGHGDSENAGFIRDSSLLVVVMITTENDCSARDPELYNPSSSTYGATDLGLRCFAHEGSALHPISRYVDGLIGLRRDPARFVLGVIAGVPTDLVPSRGERPNWDFLLSEDPSVRDPRMWPRIDPDVPSRIIPSCSVPGRGHAFPPVRLLQVARGLEARGAGVSIQSICQESFREVVDVIIERLP